MLQKKLQFTCMSPQTGTLYCIWANRKLWNQFFSIWKPLFLVRTVSLLFGKRYLTVKQHNRSLYCIEWYWMAAIQDTFQDLLGSSEYGRECFLVYLVFFVFCFFWPTWPVNMLTSSWVVTVTVNLVVSVSGQLHFVPVVLWFMTKSIVFVFYYFYSYSKWHGLASASLFLAQPNNIIPPLSYAWDHSHIVRGDISSQVLGNVSSSLSCSYSSLMFCFLLFHLALCTWVSTNLLSVCTSLISWVCFWVHFLFFESSALCISPCPCTTIFNKNSSNDPVWYLLPSNVELLIQWNTLVIYRWEETTGGGPHQSNNICSEPIFALTLNMTFITTFHTELFVQYFPIWRSVFLD